MRREPDSTDADAHFAPVFEPPPLTGTGGGPFGICWTNLLSCLMISVLVAARRRGSQKLPKSTALVRITRLLRPPATNGGFSENPTTANVVCSLGSCVVLYVSVFPFDRPTNYNEMLNKIGAFTCIEGILLTVLVGWAVPTIGAALSVLTISVKVFSVDVPVLYVVPGVLVALVARIIRLHDKVSDLFRIRSTFDVFRVLVPLAGAVGISVDEAFRSHLTTHRKKVMQRTFYEYASFEDPKISKALVLSAIDVWTWYWVLCELLVLLIATGITLLIGHAYRPAAYVFGGTWLLTMLFATVHRVCGKKADRQISEIVSDQNRAKAIRQAFGEVGKRAVA